MERNLSINPPREELTKLAEEALSVDIDKYEPYIRKTVQAMLDGLSEGPEFNLKLVKMLLICNHNYERLKEGS